MVVKIMITYAVKLEKPSSAWNILVYALYSPSQNNHE